MEYFRTGESMTLEAGGLTGAHSAHKALLISYFGSSLGGSRVRRPTTARAEDARRPGLPKLESKGNAKRKKRVFGG